MRHVCYATLSGFGVEWIFTSGAANRCLVVGQVPDSDVLYRNAQGVSAGSL